MLRMAAATLPQKKAAMSIDPDVHSSDLSLADLKQLPDVTFTFIYLFIYLFVRSDIEATFSSGS